MAGTITEIERKLIDVRRQAMSLQAQAVTLGDQLADLCNDVEQALKAAQEMPALPTRRTRKAKVTTTGAQP